jgi:hypothetical protein
MANVMRYWCFRINLFISLHFNDWRHVVLAVEDNAVGQIGAEHQLEVACRRRQPVRLVPCGSRALNINIDRAIGVRHETGSVADAVTIDRVTYHVTYNIGHRERPKCIVRRELSCMKMQDVIVLAVQLLPRTIDGRRPVRSLLRHIGGGQEFGAYSPQEDAVAGHIALHNRVPPVGRGLYCLRLIVENQICRDVRQGDADEDALDYAAGDGSFWQEGENDPICRDPICREKYQQSPHDYSLHYICDDGSPEHDGEHPFACIS